MIDSERKSLVRERRNAPRLPSMARPATAKKKAQKEVPDEAIDPKSVGGRIKTAREALLGEVTQPILARRTGLDVMTVNRLENNRTGLTRNNVTKLVMVLGDRWLTAAERAKFKEALADMKAVVVTGDIEELAPYEAAKRDELYATAGPLARAHYDVGLPREPAGKTRAERVAFYKEWLVSLRDGERRGTLGPVNVLRKGETVDEDVEES